MLDLAQGEDKVVILVKCTVPEGEEKSWKQEVTWNNLLKSIGLKILNGEGEDVVFNILGKYIASIKYEKFNSSQIDLADFEKIKVQFLSLGYIISTIV